MKQITTRLFFSAFTAVLLASATPAAGLVFVVDRLDDMAEQSGCETSQPLDCSLRTAITLANVSPGADEIHLPSGTYVLTIDGIGEDGNQFGDLDVNGELLIQGVPGHRPVIISDFITNERLMSVSGPSFFEMRDVELVGSPPGFGASVLQLGSGGQALLESVSVESAGTAGGAILSGRPIVLLDVSARASTRSAFVAFADAVIEDSYFEGALLLQAALSMKRSTIEWSSSDNPSSHQAVLALSIGGEKLIEDCRIEGLGGQRPIGGLVHVTDESLILRRTVIRGFSGSAARGGGISVDNAGSVTIEDSLIEQNTAEGGEGGGLAMIAGSGMPYTATISGTTFADNEAAGPVGSGGAIYLGEGLELVLQNSTLSGNSARFGAGLWTDAASQSSLEHVTFSGQTGSAGTAILNLGDVESQASLVDGSCSGAGVRTSFGSNLESPADSCGFVLPSDRPNVADPALAPLADGGGLTPTLTPLPGSPARDFAACVLPVDQRGAPRPHDGGGGALCDAGAVEADSPPPGSIFTDGFEQGDTSSWNAGFP